MFPRFFCTFLPSSARAAAARISFARQRVRVELDHDANVLERVLLRRAGALVLGGPDDLLDLVKADDAGKVTVADDVAGELVSALVALGRVGAVGIDERRLRPDAEASEPATGGKLEKVEAVQWAVSTPGRLRTALARAAPSSSNDKRSAAEHVAAVAHLALPALIFLEALDLSTSSAAPRALRAL